VSFRPFGSSNSIGQFSIKRNLLLKFIVFYIHIQDNFFFLHLRTEYVISLLTFSTILKF